MMLDLKLSRKILFLLLILAFIATNNAYALRVPHQTKTAEGRERLRGAIGKLSEFPEQPSAEVLENLKRFVDQNGHLSIAAFDQGTFIEWVGGNKEEPSPADIEKATIFRLNSLYYYVSAVRAPGDKPIGFLTDLPAVETLNDSKKIEALISRGELPVDFLEKVKNVPLVIQMEETRGKRGVAQDATGGFVYNTATRRNGVTVKKAKSLGAKMIKSNIFLYAGKELLDEEKEFNRRNWEFVIGLARECKEENMPFVSEVLFMVPSSKSNDPNYAKTHEYLEAHAEATVEAATVMSEIDGLTLQKLAHPYPGEAGWNSTTPEQRIAKLQEIARLTANRWLILSAGEGWETFEKKVKEAATYGECVGMLVGRTPIKDVIAKNPQGQTRLKPSKEVTAVLEGKAREQMTTLIGYFDTASATIENAFPAVHTRVAALTGQASPKGLGMAAGAATGGHTRSVAESGWKPHAATPKEARPEVAKGDVGQRKEVAFSIPNKYTQHVILPKKNATGTSL